MANKHIESKLQIACVKWFRYSFPLYKMLLCSVPNGLHTTPLQGAIAKAEGVVAGVADLMLLVPTKQFHALFIEMKTQQGRQSQSQKEWQEAVQQQGYKYAICRSVEDFIKEINEYIYGE